MLCRTLLPYVNAPFPFLIGLPAEFLPEARQYIESGDVVLVDLDGGTVQVADQPLAHIPLLPLEPQALARLPAIMREASHPELADLGRLHLSDSSTSRPHMPSSCDIRLCVGTVVPALSVLGTHAEAARTAAQVGRAQMPRGSGCDDAPESGAGAVRQIDRASDDGSGAGAGAKTANQSRVGSLAGSRGQNLAVVVDPRAKDECIELRLFFLQALLRLLRRYRASLQPTNVHNGFDHKRFLESVPFGPSREFMAELVNTQCFSVFIQKKTESLPSLAFMNPFDRCLDDPTHIEWMARQRYAIPFAVNIGAIHWSALMRGGVGERDRSNSGSFLTDITSRIAHLGEVATRNAGKKLAPIPCASQTAASAHGDNDGASSDGGSGSAVGVEESVDVPTKASNARCSDAVASTPDEVASVDGTTLGTDAVTPSPEQWLSTLSKLRTECRVDCMRQLSVRAARHGVPEFHLMRADVLESLGHNPLAALRSVEV